LTKVLAQGRLGEQGDTSGLKAMGLFRFIFKALIGKQPQNPRPVRREIRDPVTTRTERRLAKSAAALKEGMNELDEAKVINVLDGDSLIIMKADGQFEIRLSSIDCPEDGQPWGNSAKFGLIKQIGGKRVRLEEYGIDPHGRMLATIFVQRSGEENWTNVNERMVMLGHAWVSRAHYNHLPLDRRYALNRLENWARSKKVGLWGQPNPIPPWEWRRNT
jgi:micrococcal nuclease